MFIGASIGALKGVIPGAYICGAVGYGIDVPYSWGANIGNWRLRSNIGSGELSGSVFRRLGGVILRELPLPPLCLGLSLSLLSPGLYSSILSRRPDLERR